jgi:hypothetical protein
MLESEKWRKYSCEPTALDNIHPTLGELVYPSISLVNLKDIREFKSYPLFLTLILQIQSFNEYVS